MSRDRTTGAIEIPGAKYSKTKTQRFCDSVEKQIDSIEKSLRTRKRFEETLKSKCTIFTLEEILKKCPTKLTFEEMRNKEKIESSIISSGTMVR